MKVTKGGCYLVTSYLLVGLFSGLGWYFHYTNELNKEKERFQQATELRATIKEEKRNTILGPKPFYSEFHYTIKAIRENDSTINFHYTGEYAKHIDDFVSEGDQITFREGFRPFDNF